MSAPWNPYPDVGTRVLVLECSVRRHKGQEGVVIKSDKSCMRPWGRAIEIGGEICNSPFVARVR